MVWLKDCYREAPCSEHFALISDFRGYIQLQYQYVRRLILIFICLLNIYLYNTIVYLIFLNMHFWRDLEDTFSLGKMKDDDLLNSDFDFAKMRP